MKTCFSEGKLMKQFGPPPFSTSLPISEQFFHAPAPPPSSGVFIVNFEHISHLFLVFLLLTLNK